MNDSHGIARKKAHLYSQYFDSMSVLLRIHISWRQVHSMAKILIVGLLLQMTDTANNMFINIYSYLPLISHEIVMTCSYTSRSGKRSLSSSFRTFHLLISGGINMLMYSGLLRWCPTESASVPIASYNMSKFLCWYLLKAYTRVCKMKPKYGTSSVHASSSRVAKAEHAASCTRLLLSRTRLSNWKKQYKYL